MAAGASVRRGVTIVRTRNPHTGHEAAGPSRTARISMSTLLSRTDQLGLRRKIMMKR